MTNKKFMNRILFIIFLTNLPLLIIMPMLFKEVIGWLFGSVASAINFYWLYRQVNQLNCYNEKESTKNAWLGFNLRYMFLLVWSVAVILIIKPNIVLYGVGLLSAQLAIFIHTAYETIKNSPWAKYYRGNDDE
jgi:hypothetical protein